jgi:hypothetical protein
MAGIFTATILYSPELRVWLPLGDLLTAVLCPSASLKQQISGFTVARMNEYFSVCVIMLFWDPERLTGRLSNIRKTDLCSLDPHL